MAAFADLDEIEQAVLVTASEEGLLWEACAEWSRDPSRRTSEDVGRTRRAAVALVERRLVWMYRVEDGNPDLDEAEVQSILGDGRAWVHDSEWPNDVALYLTPAGEAIYHRAHT